MAQHAMLDRAKANLVYRHPFFASILMRRPLIEDKRVGTAGVCQRGHIYYNPDFINGNGTKEFPGLTLEQCIFLLCHEVMHVVGMHAARLHEREHQRWNIAADAWINDLLQTEKIGEFIPGGVDMPGSMHELVDDIYNRLPIQPPNSGGPGGIGSDLLQRGDPMTEEEAQSVTASTKVALAQAAQAAKMAGNMPESIAALVADLIASKVPWHDVLERYMVGYTKSDPSWRRPNRRFEAYLPSTGKLPAMGKVVLQIDVSGSISKLELDHYNGHIQRIVELCRPEQVDVLYVDTQVAKHVTFQPDEEVKLEFYSGGGTDMEAGFRYIDKEGMDPDVVVVLTDGYTDFTTPPDVPVVWVCSTKQEIPYGTVIRFDPND